MIVAYRSILVKISKAVSYSVSYYLWGHRLQIYHVSSAIVKPGPPPPSGWVQYQQIRHEQNLKFFMSWNISAWFQDILHFVFIRWEEVEAVVISVKIINCLKDNLIKEISRSVRRKPKISTKEVLYSKISGRLFHTYNNYWQFSVWNFGAYNDN